nr:integrase, catalytic region, zinc finger, CCHC-type, peptidase aspartic, catalytic [Tanacetum cinerariifolium]
MDDDMAPDAQVHSSDDEDIENAHIPKTGDMAMFIDWLCKRQGITKLKPRDLEGPVFELVKVFHPNVIHLQYQMEEYHKLLTDSVDDSIIMHNVNNPLPLGGPPGPVTIQFEFFFNKDLEYLRYSSKGSRPALSILEMKAAYYPDVGLEQMTPDQIWIEEECKYSIAAMYGISHWWFQRQRFYINRHTSEGDRRAVRNHMRILSVVRIEVFSMYGYDYMKKIVLRKTDLNEHIIVERDFKYLYPSDFEDLYLLNLQGHLNHLPPKDKKIITTAVNLWTRHLDATGFEYKHDYTVIDSPRAVTFLDKYEVQMIMRFNEIHKFSDGTLHHINEELDYLVKEFKVAVSSSLRSLKPKRTIESRAKISSKIISLGHYSTMLASSHTVKNQSLHARIPRTPSSNEKNKVEVQSRKVKSSLNKRNSNSKNACNEHVKHPVKGVKALCYVSNKCLFYANHAMCLIDHVNSMNVHAKSASKKNKKRKEWKPTRKVFTKNGYQWRPTGRTFNLVGNTSPLTRINATNKVPLRVPIPLELVAPEHAVTRVYTRRSKVPKYVPNSKPKVVQIVLWYLDSGCSKHMTGDRSQLTNFVNKFLGTVKFGNDQVVKIMRYGDCQIGNVTISKVYYVEGLGHNLFSVGQFCVSDLEVAFKKHTCFVCNLEGVDLLSGSRGTNLYSLSIEDMMAVTTGNFQNIK